MELSSKPGGTGQGGHKSQEWCFRGADRRSTCPRHLARNPLVTSLVTGSRLASVQRNASLLGLMPALPCSPVRPRRNPVIPIPPYPPISKKFPVILHPRPTYTIAKSTKNQRRHPNIEKINPNTMFHLPPDPPPGLLQHRKSQSPGRSQARVHSDEGRGFPW